MRDSQRASPAPVDDSSSADASLTFQSAIPASTPRAESRVNTHWDPPFLRYWVLIAFIIFFVASIAGLQAVYSVSTRHHGIANSDSNLHYLWTYGPTAIFVVVTVLWRQVDYAAKSIQPWAEMATKAPKPAKSSLLLDYVTPFQIVSLWNSIRNGHFNVSSTIAVFFLLKVVTIISTSAFELESVARNNVAATMTLNNTFDGSAFTSVDSRAAYIVYGSQQYGVSLPLGTTESYAAQSFSPRDGFHNGSLAYSASVDVFSASLLQCTSGKIDYTTGFSRSSNAPVAAYYNSSVSLPGCQIYNAVLDAPDWYWLQNDTTHRFGYRGSFQNVTCSNLPPDDPTRDRYMISVAYSEGFSQNNNTMLNSSNIVCIPSYSIRPGTVIVDMQGNILSVKVTGIARTLDDVSGIDIANGVLASATQASSVGTTSGSNLVLDTFMTLMQEDTPFAHPEELLDASYINSTANRVFGKVSAQLARLYLLSPTSPASLPTVEGTVSEDQNRLVAREVPVRIMQGISGAMILLALVVIFGSPRGVVPRSIDSIAAVAAILARSPALEERLRGTGHMNLEQLGVVLSPYRFQTRVAHDDTQVRTFAIQMSTATQSEIKEVPVNDDTVLENVTWIRPFVLRRVAISCTILAAVAAIVTLEILLSRSQANDGLGGIKNEGTIRYSWLYVPVLVFVLLGTLFNIMDFEIEFTESYHALAKGYCTASASMFWYPLRHVSLHATWNGLKHSRFALTAASASAVLAPFLTIVVSGLFFTRPTVQDTSIELTAVNWFNTTTGTSPSTNIPALVIEGNMSYPKWTYDELAIPQLRIDADGNNAATGGSLQIGSVSVDTPTLRAAVDCTVVPKDRVLNTTIQAGALQSNISTPDGCGNAGFGDSPDLWLTNYITVPVNASGYFGTTLTLGFGGPKCPTVALYYGHVSESNELTDFTTIVCVQSVERLQANVTLDLPGLTISTPPTVQPETAVPFSTWYNSFPTLQTLNITSTADILDPTFSAMVYGRDGIPTDDLLNTTTLITSYTHVYRQYMAQIFNEYLRAPFADLSHNATETIANPLAATHTNPQHLRLVQSSLSTQLLVGVLGALLLCAATIFVTVDMRHVLPKPMGSVAAVASLLAGSRIVDARTGLIPRGSEFWSDDQWEKSGVWQGEMFRMGWWGKFGEPIESWKAAGKMDQEMVLGVMDGPGSQTRLVSDAGSGRKTRGLGLGSFRIDVRPKIVA